MLRAKAACDLDAAVALNGDATQVSISPVFMCIFRSVY
jgi:hypothetical protein